MSFARCRQNWYKLGLHKTSLAMLLCYHKINIIIFNALRLQSMSRTLTLNSLAQHVCYGLQPQIISTMGPASNYVFGGFVVLLLLVLLILWTPIKLKWCALNYIDPLPVCLHKAKCILLPRPTPGKQWLIHCTLTSAVDRKFTTSSI